MKRESSRTCLCLIAAGLVAGCQPESKHQRAEDVVVTLHDLPSSVQSHFQRDYPAASIKKVERSTDDGVTHYDIEILTHSGDEQKIVYNREGDEIKDAPAK